jgi:hypothetical protein
MSGLKRRKDVKAVHNLVWRPRCFEEDITWNEWIEAARLVTPRPDSISTVVSVCVDCTQSYQAEMIKKGKCGNTKSLRA